MEHVGQVIKRLRDERGLTQGQLATYAEVTRAWLSVLESKGMKQPSRDKLERVAAVLRVPLPILLGAAGYRTTPVPMRQERTPGEVMRELEALLRKKEENEPLVLTEAEQSISAGAGAASEAERWAYYPRPGERGHEFVPVRVVGTCLEPRIHEGETVIVDKTASPRPGDIVAAVHDSENIVKILEVRDGDYWLVALQEQPPIKINGGTRILGVVVQIGRRP